VPIKSIMRAAYGSMATDNTQLLQRPCPQAASASVSTNCLITYDRFVTLLSEISLRIAARTDICSFKVAVLFLRERSRNKRVRERSRALLKTTRAVENVRSCKSAPLTELVWRLTRLRPCYVTSWHRLISYVSVNTALATKHDRSSHRRPTALHGLA